MKSKSISVEQYLYKQTYLSGFVSYLVRIKKLHAPGEWRRRFQTEQEARDWKKWVLDQRELNKPEPPKKKEKVKAYSDKPGIRFWGGL